MPENCCFQTTVTYKSCYHGMTSKGHWWSKVKVPNEKSYTTSCLSQIVKISLEAAVFQLQPFENPVTVVLPCKVMTDQSSIAQNEIPYRNSEFLPAQTKMLRICCFQATFTYKSCDHSLTSQDHWKSKVLVQNETLHMNSHLSKEVWIMTCVEFSYCSLKIMWPWLTDLH